MHRTFCTEIQKHIPGLDSLHLPCWVYCQMVQAATSPSRLLIRRKSAACVCGACCKCRTRQPSPSDTHCNPVVPLRQLLFSSITPQATGTVICSKEAVVSAMQANPTSRIPDQTRQRQTKPDDVRSACRAKTLCRTGCGVRLCRQVGRSVPTPNVRVGNSLFLLFVQSVLLGLSHPGHAWRPRSNNGWGPQSPFVAARLSLRSRVQLAKLHVGATKVTESTHESMPCHTQVDC